VRLLSARDQTIELQHELPLDQKVHRCGGRKEGEIEKLMPSDDEIWLHKERSWAEWTKITGLAHRTMKRDFEARGWVKATNGLPQMKKGPCAICGRSVPIIELSLRRECRACAERIQKTSVYRREFSAWLERHPEMEDRMMRQREEDAGLLVGI